MNSIDDCELVNGRWCVANLLVRHTLIGSNLSISVIRPPLRRVKRDKMVNLGPGSVAEEERGIDTVWRRRIPLTSNSSGAAFSTAGLTIDEESQRRKLRINHRLLYVCNTGQLDN